MYNDISNIKSRFRYPGVKPFTTEQQELFFGREKDTVDLFDLILARQMVVLYGKSGYGKSSLINAGIIPKLKTETEFQNYMIRFKNNSKTESNGLKPNESLNQELINQLSEREQIIPKLLEFTNGETPLWYWIKALQWHRKQTQFIFFFDQFEELFTYEPEDVEKLSTNLADALYMPVPLRYRQQFSILRKAGTLSDDFYDFLNDKPDIKVVFSIRADRMSLLNGLNTRHPAILSNCYELSPLSTTEACTAIIEPAELDGLFDSKPFVFAEKALTKIFDEIEDYETKTVETPVLQIICSYVEKELVIKQNIEVVNEDDLGEISGIFQRHYVDSLNSFDIDVRNKIQEFVEEKLITNNQRNSLSQSYILSEFQLNLAILQVLEERSILRKERGVSGQILYELSHDSLIEPIQQVAQVRLQFKEAEKKKALEAEIEREKRRNEKLTNLTRIAWVVSFIAVIIAIIAGYYWFEAVKSREEASNNLETARQFFEETNLKEADRILGVANSFIEYGEDSLALSNLFFAKQLLEKKNSIFSPNSNNSDSVKSERAVLYVGYSNKNKSEFEKRLKLINEKIVYCENKLEKP